MTNSVPLLPNFKKLYLYYLKRISSLSFWIVLTLGIVWSGFRIFIERESEKIRTSNSYQQKAKKFEERLEEQEQSLKSQGHEDWEIKLILTGERISKKISTLNKIKDYSSRNAKLGLLSLELGFSTLLDNLSVTRTLLATIVFFLLFTLFPFNTDTKIRTLLGWTTPPASFFNRQKKQRTGEDEMVLTFASATTRRTIAFSKFFAYLTQCLIINFVWIILPCLFNPSNWTNHLGSLLKYLLAGGLIFPLLVFGFSSLFFYWLEIAKYWMLFPLLGFYAVVGLLLWLSSFSEEKIKELLISTLKITIQNYLLFTYLTLFVFLLLDSGFFYLYYRDFQTTDFS